jgi:hypothetical protein
LVEIVIAVGVIIGVVLLWEMLRVQRARLRVEAAPLLVHVAQEQFASAAARAKRDHQLNEFTRTLIRDARRDGELAVLTRFAEEDPTSTRDVELEARARNVPCAFLDEGLPWSWGAQPPKFPGPEPQPDSTPRCSEHCDGSREVLGVVPPEELASPSCPFCGAPMVERKPGTGNVDWDALRARWRSKMVHWNAFKTCFPLTAAEMEAAESEERERVEQELLAEARDLIAKRKSKDP